MPYQLFIANKNYSSWSMRAWVALEALGIPFEEELTPFKGAGPQTDFMSFSPSAKVPCLHEGDNVVWDSLAIIEYVAEAYPDLWPQSRAARAWARCATAEMHSGFPALRDECSMNCALRIALGTPSEALQEDLARLDALWCEGLKRFGGPWLAGDRFTAVDAFFAPVAVRIHGYGLPLGETALLYAQRLLEHPSVADWITQGIAEPWIDEPHEQDCLRGRRVLEDRRA
ncbi:glutathione S-transferase family protein [Chromohalobacter sp. 296-RDG]|uniref:glutathione S-transferase family protein n=1 Tax=Chromohalobacter sp. 296-RDG TaxID=2994062 RepID=UPI002468C1D0|nr:glutathione S-transferase family protein [Chromohalobacter sp. 296-RDG]